MKFFAGLVAVIFAVVVVLIAGAWRSPIILVVRPDPAGFDQALVERGADLASIGNCNTCHTAPGGRPYAGGVGLTTPFGVIYSTNITPDQTGIGNWSEVAFGRALREGVARDGSHLYPVFPYDHFTLLSDDDVRALYAYFMTLEPVRVTPSANEVPFPLNVRLILAGWKLLFFQPGRYKPDPAQSVAWNKGAYLVEGLAHCGACHTPRNSMGAETKDLFFAGGEAEGWSAYALNQASPTPIPWNAEALGTYLRRGWHEEDGIARGPMAAVINNLAAIPDDDLNAMTTYLADFLENPSEERQRAAQALLERAGSRRQAEPGSDELQTIGRSNRAAGEETGARIYESACANCHDGVRPFPFGGIDLTLSTGPSGPNARNVINVVLWGLPPAEGDRNPSMPGFAGSLTDAQLVELLNYTRSQFSGKPAWTGIESDIRNARTQPTGIYAAPGTDPSKAVVTKHEAR